VFREARRLVFDVFDALLTEGGRVLEDMFCAARGIVFVLFLLFVVLYTRQVLAVSSLLTRLSIVYSSFLGTVSCCRARKWSTQVRFLSLAYVEGSSLPFRYCTVMFGAS